MPIFHFLLLISIDTRLNVILDIFVFKMKYLKIRFLNLMCYNKMNLYNKILKKIIKTQFSLNHPIDEIIDKINLIKE